MYAARLYDTASPSRVVKSQDSGLASRNKKLSLVIYVVRGNCLVVSDI